MGLQQTRVIDQGTNLIRVDMREACVNIDCLNYRRGKAAKEITDSPEISQSSSGSQEQAAPEGT